MNSHSNLPEIKDYFYNAMIKNVNFGPRREVMLTVRRLIWVGRRGHADDQLTYIRFGGVNNMEAVRKFFSEKPYQRSELLTIDYSKTRNSKPGSLFLDIKFERIDDEITVECLNLSISRDDIES